MKTRLIVIAIICYFGYAPTVARAQSGSIMIRAGEYADALRRYQRQNGRASVESVIRKGKAVAEKLDEIEQLSDSDYALLEKKMRGFTVNREEILFIEPDLKFYSRLSRDRGTNADIAFFRLMRKIRPHNVWAAYIEQQTDVTGCTIYGNGLLTRLYGDALRFKRAFPKSFIPDINEEIERILEAFSENGCACGGRDGVLREFRSFIKTYPKDKSTTKIKAILKELKTRSGFRFNCHSG